MAASYPGAIVSFPTVLDDDGAGGGTDLEAVLATSANDEIFAIESEMGLEPHGSAGSVAERLMFEFMPDGKMRHKLENWEGGVEPTLVYTARKIMGDKLQTAVSANSVTFNEAFAQTPAVFLSVQANDSNNYPDCKAVVLTDPVSTTGFSFSAFTATGAPISQQQRFNWVAITRDPPATPPV